MTEIMTPSRKPMTDGQINQAVSRYRTLLESNSTNLSSETVQKILGSKAYSEKQFELLREHSTSFESLSRVEDIEVKLPFDLEPTKFYKGDRFILRGGFDRGELVQLAATVPRGRQFKLSIWEVTKSMWESQIWITLGHQCRFSGSDICAVLAALVAAQDPDEKGFLSHEDEAVCNVMFHQNREMTYVKSCVCSFTGKKRWFFNTIELSEMRKTNTRLEPGDRIFSLTE